MSPRTVQKLTDEQDLLIGQRLKLLRKQGKFSLEDVAKGLNMTVSSYRNYEYSRNMPSARVIKKLSEFYDVSADFILGIVEFPFPINRQKSG